jgi:hypothetical protein
MSDQIFPYKGNHAFVFPPKKNVGKTNFKNSLKVVCNKSESKN